MVKNVSCPLGIVRNLPLSIDAWDNSFTKIHSVSNYPEVYAWVESRGYDPHVFETRHDLYYPLQEKMMDGRIVFKVETGYNNAYQAYRFVEWVEPKVFTPKGIKLTDLLYNYNEVREKSTIFVVEGIFDVARLDSWGLDAVAALSCGLSDRQNKWLSQTLADEIVLGFDHGLYQRTFKFANRLQKICSDKNISVMNITKEGADPDSSTKEDFLSYYENRTFI